VFELHLRKPDGRRLTLYSRTEIQAGLVAPAPPGGPAHVNPHFRWHPLRGEWVAYAGHRQARTFLPPPDYNPLRPSSDPAAATELPTGDYEIAVFDNLFPAMSLGAHDAPASIIPTAPAKGHCEVVVFTQDPDASLGKLDLARLDLLLEVFGSRTKALRESGAHYVLPFENRGQEVGVTLHHPHGQIYAYPFIPPVPERMHQREREHFTANRRAMLEQLIQVECEAGTRVLFQSEHAVAFVPAWARYPYEVWVAPRAAVPDFESLTPAQRTHLARALKTTLLKYDGLWQRPFPYVMAWYQAPLVGATREAHHLHAEFLPAYRMPGRLKYLAGTEIAAGMFTNDTLPEEKAKELQAVTVSIQDEP
jgi:UDPglucose--hexose-1-phosphate uridylyltransferase